MLPIASEGVFDGTSSFTINGKEIDSKLWASFMGWYLSEGCCENNKNYRVIISQFIPENQEKIYKLLNKLPFHFFFNNGRFIICNKVLWMYLMQFGKSYDKYVPQVVKEFPLSSLKCFIDSMVDGDGWEHKGNRTIATVSKQLADDVSEILVKTGKATTLIEREQKDSIIKSTGQKVHPSCNIFYITERNRYRACLRNKDGDSLIKTTPYSGDTYCVSVPNQTLLVRRKGLTTFTGNCHYFALANFGWSKPRMSKGVGNFYS